MMNGRPRTRIQKKNHEVILAAGLEVFSQFGLRGSTLDQIAEAAGLSKPNLLYYFRSKEAIYTALLERLLDTWLDPLRELDPEGDPVTEILDYLHRKIDMSRDYPRESRIFANEILQGAPHIEGHLSGELREMVNETASVIEGWAAAGRIRPVDAHHLIFSIWALTQHYADFDVQVRAVLDDPDPIPRARQHLDEMFRRMIAP